MTFLKKYDSPTTHDDIPGDVIEDIAEIVEQSNAVVVKNERGNTTDIKSMEQDIIYSKDELSERGIIHQGMDEKVVANAFRNLRTTLLKKMEKPNSCILISALSEEGGASFTATNLAAAFAFDQKKTALLVDCDFTNSNVAENLGVNAEFGLKDYITDQIDNVSDIVFPTVVPRLRLVPSGFDEGDYDEYFTSRKMRAFIEEVSGRYPDRVIIMNAPPVLESADTQILTELCDHVVFVLPYSKVQPESVRKAIKAVDKDKIAGFIINN